jgi:hypothetical protein
VNPKYGFHIHANPDLDGKRFEIELEDIYDVLITLFSRYKVDPILPNKGKLLTIKDWTTEEGEQAKKRLKKLAKDLDRSGVVYENLGGNRIEAEYYKGLLILTNDILLCKSNVIEIAAIDFQGLDN